MKKETTFKVSLLVALWGLIMTSHLDVLGQTEVINQFPYQESFEQGPNGWSSRAVADTVNSWKLGTPAGPVIRGASDGEAAWTTNLNGGYAAVENSAVLSPVFDFTNLPDPRLTVDIWYELFETDGVVLEAFTGSSEGWEIVGAADPNFYNDSIRIQVNEQLVYVPAWTGNNTWGNTGSGGYITVRTALTAYAGQSSVQFRFRLISPDEIDRLDPIDGFAFDQVRINNAPAGGEFADFFFAGGEQVPVNIPDNAIGVLLEEEASESSLDSLLDALNYPDSDSISDRIYRVNLGRSLSREALRTVSDSIRTLGEGIIRQAGLLTFVEGAARPLVTTDEIIVKFSSSASEQFINNVINSDSLDLIMLEPYTERVYLLRTSSAAFDAFSVANNLELLPQVEFSHPNFIRIIEFRQVNPNDPLFANQWHHRNTGQAGNNNQRGTPDADIDTDLAWEFTLGNANTVIAIIDDGFDMTHPDLTPNYWTNPRETDRNQVDDDRNGFVDDINGWDFAGNDNSPAPGGNHGTAVAGAAAASGNNGMGVSGSCPECRLMLLRVAGGGDFAADARSFRYATNNGARIISASWGYSLRMPMTNVVVDAINQAAGAEIVVFFANSNEDRNDCAGNTPDISSLANVISVSRSTNRDRFDLSGFGNCMDLLAPSFSEDPERGTLGGVTTDRQGEAGYNNNNPLSQSIPETNDLNYTFRFRGTSFATPVVAGVAGLILSANAELPLNRLQVQRLLQDAADKIEDSQGRYAAVNGFSRPAGGVATHGWGRVNAFEAVRIVAPPARRGRGGVDVFLRDNRLDWGNTASAVNDPGAVRSQGSNTLFEPTRGFIPHWESLDIKIDAPDAQGNYQTAPTDQAGFEALADEEPVTGQTNRVYVRVRNRGPVTANAVTVKLLWTYAGTALPRLPDDFWTRFPDDPNYPPATSPLDRYNTINTQTINNLAYSGPSVANTGDDRAQIARFDFVAPARPEAGINHFCLVAVAHSPQDPVSEITRSRRVLDEITPNDNNITHRNVRLQDTRRDALFVDRFLIRNPFPFAGTFRLNVLAAEEFAVDIEGAGPGGTFVLQPGESRVITSATAIQQVNLAGEVEIRQVLVTPDSTQTLGGITYRYQNEEMLGKAPVAAMLTCPEKAVLSCSFPVKVSVDMTQAAAPDSLLGSFTSRLEWDPAVLTLKEPVAFLSGFNGVTNLDTRRGVLIFNGTNTAGAGGIADVLQANFTPIGEAGTAGSIRVRFTALAAANTFRNLLPGAITMKNCVFTVVSGELLGDVNGDELVNSTDALIVLSFDVGLPIPEAIAGRIARGVGDVNKDKATNSTDALIILTYDAGHRVKFPVGKTICPSENAPMIALQPAAARQPAVPIRVVMDQIAMHKGMLQVPLYADVTASGKRIGSYTVTVTWNADVLQYIPSSAANPHLIMNEESAKEGVLKLAYAHPEGLSAAARLFTLTFLQKDLNRRNGLTVSFDAAASTVDFSDLTATIEVISADSPKLAEKAGSIARSTKIDSFSELEEKNLNIHPNPINQTTHISYFLTTEGQVLLEVYNSTGQMVKTIVDKQQRAGSHGLVWDGSDNAGRALSSGIYVVTLKTKKGTVSRAILKL